jgi:sodium transport system permease protein
MIRTILTVCRKEILETARDRRTVFSLLLGPLLGPLLFVTIINVAVSRNLSGFDQPLDLPIVGAERAPNLLAFLEARGLRQAVRAPLTTLDETSAAVSRGEHDVAIVIDDRYAKDFGTEHAARVTVVFDRSKSSAQSKIERVRSTLAAYGQQIGTLRLVANGVSPSLLQPLIVDDLDVSTPAGRSVLMLGVLTYFLLFATLTGGLHLAIDTTAGERERKSLEPLLALPVSRASLLLGKMLATVCYMLVSLGLTLAAFTLALKRVPLEQLGMSSSFDGTTALATFAILCPFAPLGAALMTTVASFTKTYREAQTYLTFVLLVPTLPLMFAALLNVEAELKLMWIPSLSQHLLITSLIKAQPLDGLFLAISAVSSLVLGALLGWVAIRLYEREAILG